MCRSTGMYGVRYSRWVWASKPVWRFRGTNDTWRHRGVSVKAKLPHKLCRFGPECYLMNYVDLDQNDPVVS